MSTALIRRTGDSRQRHCHAERSNDIAALKDREVEEIAIVIPHSSPELPLRENAERPYPKAWRRLPQNPKRSRRLPRTSKPDTFHAPAQSTGQFWRRAQGLHIHH
jgi:hypothetical protein